MAAEGGSIEADLARRDLTVNAIAEPLAASETLIDPSGGVRRSRAAPAASRLRSAVPRGSAAGPAPGAAGRRARARGRARDRCAWPGAAPAGCVRVAPERVFAELRAGDQPAIGRRGARADGPHGAPPRPCCPSSPALDGIEQSRFHHLDVLDHTRAVLAETIALRAGARGSCSGPTGERAGATFWTSRWPTSSRAGRRCASARCCTTSPSRRRATGHAEGRITFMRHDEAGAPLAAEILGRLRASERLSQYVAALTRHHLRLGFLVHRMPLRAARGLPLPGGVLAGRGRRHRAQRGRPAGHAWRQRRARYRPASRARPADPARGAGLVCSGRREPRCAATS